MHENRALGFVVQRDFASGSDLVETNEGCTGAVSILSPWMDRADYVSRKFAVDFDGVAVTGNSLGSGDHLFKHERLGADLEVSGVWGDTSTPTTPFPDGLRLVYLAPWRRTFSVNNVSRRNLINKTTGMGLDHTDDCPVGCVVFDAEGETSSIQYFDGCNIAPVNGINHMKVQGSGFCGIGCRLRALRGSAMDNGFHSSNAGDDSQIAPVIPWTVRWTI